MPQPNPGQRASTKLLELTSHYKMNPQNIREEEPEVNEYLTVKPPKYFNRAEKNAWNEILVAAPEFVLTRSEKFIVEICAKLLAEFRRDGTVRGQSAEGVDLFYKMDPARISRMEVCLGKIGLNPSDRSKVQMTRPSAKSTYD